MNNGAMLNAYPDSLGGCLGGAAALISRPEFADVFRSFYVLPSLFHTDLDRGFSAFLLFEPDWHRQLYHVRR